MSLVDSGKLLMFEKDISRIFYEHLQLSPCFLEVLRKSKRLTRNMQNYFIYVTI